MRGQPVTAERNEAGARVIDSRYWIEEARTTFVYLYWLDGLEHQPYWLCTLGMKLVQRCERLSTDPRQRWHTSPQPSYVACVEAFLMHSLDLKVYIICRDTTEQV
jgi:hypothetical protein